MPDNVAPDLSNPARQLMSAAQAYSVQPQPSHPASAPRSLFADEQIESNIATSSLEIKDFGPCNATISFPDIRDIEALFPEITAPTDAHETPLTARSAGGNVQTVSDQLQTQVMNDPTLPAGGPLAYPLLHNMNSLLSDTQRSGDGDANYLRVDPDLEFIPDLIPALDRYLDFDEGLQQAGAPVASSRVSPTSGNVPTSCGLLQTHVIVDDTLTLPEDENVSMSAL